MLTAVEELVSEEYLRFVVERLASFGSSPLGFRVAGTSEERGAAAFVADELRGLGFSDVVEEHVPVDAWRFREAFVEVGGRRYEAVSMGGVPGTGARGVAGELVTVRRGGRRELAHLAVDGKVVLVDWSDDRLWPHQFGLELGLRGAAAVIVFCGPGGPWFQAHGALGTHDGMWHPEAPPLAIVRKEDGALLSRKEGSSARVVVRAGLRPGAATNVVGLLPGRRRGPPLVVGAHHDGWFAGAFDDATGVAVTLALARALVEANLRPVHPLAFVSHTAEEYGIAWSRWDWCFGAWYQITQSRRRWASRVPFYLNIEGSGLPFPLRADAPPELTRLVRGVLRRAARDGLLPYGFRLDRPNTFTEVWTFLAAGVPGINVSSFAEPWYRADYHTQHDTADRIDFPYLAALTRVFARLLLEVDANPDGVLDYEAREQHVRRALATTPPGRARAQLERSLARLRRTRGRDAFTAIGRGLHGLDAWGRAAYPHEQAVRDIGALEQALASVRAGQAAVAARYASRAGLNRLCADLSAGAFELELERSRAGAPRASWARQGRLDPGPNLWHELAALRREQGARPLGPWVERSLSRHLARARRELDRRLERMAAAVGGQVPRLPRPRAEDLPGADWPARRREPS